MANILIEEATMVAIASAIREMKGITGGILAKDMPAAIESISAGEPQNGIVYDVINLENVVKATVYGNYVKDYLCYKYTKLTNIIFKGRPTSIGGHAFFQCTALDNVVIPDTVKIIYGNAFQSCGALTNLTLPSSLEQVEGYAFANDYSLVLSEIPANVKSIKNYAFTGCTAITSLTFKGTPTTIEANAFMSCSNLKTINVPWLEGAVANAPWGATGATINYGVVI